MSGHRIAGMMHDNASGLREVMFNSEAGEAVQIGLEAIKALSSPLFQGPLADSVRERPMYDGSAIIKRRSETGRYASFLVGCLAGRGATGV
jgi:hypothetical protein